MLREKQGNSADTSKGSFVAANWNIENTTSTYTAESSNSLANNLAYLGLENLHRPAVLREPAAGLSATDRFDLTLTAVTPGPNGTTETIAIGPTAATGATTAGLGLEKLKDAVKTYAEATSTDLAG